MNECWNTFAAKTRLKENKAKTSCKDSKNSRIIKFWHFAVMHRCAEGSDESFHDPWPGLAECFPDAIFNFSFSLMESADSLWAVSSEMLAERYISGNQMEAGKTGANKFVILKDFPSLRDNCCRRSGAAAGLMGNWLADWAASWVVDSAVVSR